MTVSRWQQRFDLWLAEHSGQADAAHDAAHVRRVWRTARYLMAGEQVDEVVILTACYFHDIVALAKNHPQRHLASKMAADKTETILKTCFADFPEYRYAPLRHAIEAHSFSAGIAPQTLEAKIVQDADRLEALGAIGLARVFAVAGSLDIALFDSDDPFAQRRALDDRRYALDHFRSKLLRLPATMQTAKGRAFAQSNANYLVQFMGKLAAELQGDFNGVDADVLERFTLRDTVC